jgi:cobalt-precorrin 5A hydrolase/precorrin-3B C17-methyltransferase
MTPAIVVLSKTALPLATEIAAAAKGEVHGLAGRANEAEVRFENTATHIAGLFREGRPVIAVMASGAVIRMLAPLLADKTTEPPVIAVAEDGSSVVPLLGGHHGANELASVIAARIGGHAAITTAGDLRFGIALDAPPEGYRLANPENAKAVMAALLNGERAEISGEAPWLSESSVPISRGGKARLTVTENAASPGKLELIYHAQTLALGIGCERGCDPEEALATTRQALAAGGYSERSVGVVVSLDLKADEAAVHHVAAAFGCPARFFDAATLEAETPRLENPSDTVFAEVGCHGVSEGAALAAAGPDGLLVVPKVKSARATAAIANAAKPFVTASLPGRARGRLFVVGIGPGSQGWRSPEVSALVSRATDLVGYSLYLDLLGPLAQGKIRHAYDLGAEEERVRRAMELAGEGRDVALVCSGDAGIYAMATLVFELIDKGGVSDAAKRIDIQVSPGISALQAAAARAGAPLGHDFCAISLSDLLTPWEMIKKRVHAAAEADFVIAFYNPVSRKRRTQLAYARDVLLEHRPADAPVILATNLGREGENVRIVPLGELDIDDVDMLTVVIAGSSQSCVVKTGDGREWTYTPRGYADKSESAMKGANLA